MGKNEFSIYTIRSKMRDVSRHIRYLEPKSNVINLGAPLMPNRFLVSLALLFAFIPAAYAEDVYRDCSNLVTDYAMYRDRFDAEAFSNLFTEDASLTVLGQTWEGRNSIRERMHF